MSRAETVRRLSSYWLELGTRADFAVAQELVQGLTSDLLATKESFWRFLPDHTLTAFDVAALKALSEEAKHLPLQTRAFEWAVQHVAR